MTDIDPKKNIDYLLVGKDEGFLKTVDKFINKNGDLNTEIAAGATLAREILFKSEVKFIISEITIPHMNGIELLRLIRRNPQFFDIPVVMIADSDNTELIKFTREELADDILIKPVEEGPLLETIRQIKESRNNLSEEGTLIKECRRLLIAREYEKALDLALGSMGPDENEELLFIISQCYYRLKKFSKAIVHLKNLINKSSSSCKAMHLLGKICLAEDNCGDAIVLLNKAYSQNPSNLDLKIDLAKLYLAMGMEEEANKQFAGTLESEPSDLNLIKIGRAYLKKGKLKKAGIFFNRVKNPIPETAYIFGQYGLALEKKEAFEEALTQYKRCAEMAPNNINYLLSLAKSYLKLGNSQDARIIAENILKREPDHSQAKKILAFIDTLGLSAN